MDQPTSPRKLIAVALAEPTTDAARQALQRAAHLADIVELRLDLMDEFDLARLLADRPCPVVVTCRAVREGGRWRGSEAERLDVLRAAIDRGAEYVDVEADCFDAIRDRGRSHLIASSHDFVGMPADLPGRWRELAATGADVVKVVGMARDARDVVPVMQTLAAADRPTIAIAMGPAGLATRVLALRHESCLLTFCALETGGGTAVGQIGAAELIEVYGARQLTSRTRVVGLFGPEVDPLALRRWNGALRGEGAAIVAVPLLAPADANGPDVLSSLRPLDLHGSIVGPPHQETVGQALDRLDGSACRAGRVNLVVRQGGQLVGYWLDGEQAAVELLAAEAVAS